MAFKNFGGHIPIFSFQILGLLYAFLVQIGLCGLAKSFKNLSFGFSYLLTIALASSVLCLSAILPVYYLVVVSIGLGIFLFAKNPAPILTSIRPFFSGKSAWFAIGVIFIDCLYASFPDYRYDQWNYHLLVGKYISLIGPFKKPIFYDPVFFSGSFEYWSISPRLISQNDVWNHCAANAFSFSCFFIGFCALIWEFCRHLKFHPGTLFLTTICLLFAIPDHEALVSAKPDPQLIVIGMAILSLLIFKKDYDKRRWFLIGLFLIYPISFKLTYLHFSGAVSLSIVTLFLLRREIPNFKGLFAGIFLGFVLTLPFFIKNYLFFGNPVHPIQFAFLKSSYWNNNFSEYWNGVSHRCDSIQSFLNTLLLSPFSFLGHITLFFVMIVLCLSLVKKHKNFWMQYRTAFLRCILAMGFYFLIWPIFFDDAIFARFLYASLSVAVLFTVLCLSYLKNLKHRTLILCVPLLLGSALEVKILRMSDGMAKSSEEFFQKKRWPFEHYNPSMIINAHRKKLGREFNYLQHTVLTNTAIGYFLDSARLDTISPDWSYHFQRVNEIPLTDTVAMPCYFRVLKDMDIHYFWNMLFDYKNNPSKSFEELTRFGEKVDPNYEIFYFSDTTIAEIAGQPCQDNELKLEEAKPKS